MSKWIEFHEEPTDGKTRKFWVHPIDEPEDIGSIKWDGHTSEYRFFPNMNTSWDPDSLNEISALIKKLMEERKKK